MEAFNRLPDDVKRQARAAYRRFRDNPFYPELRFKKVNARLPIWSVRIGDHYRAISVMEEDEIVWQWIGPHAEYDKLLSHW